jgi:hypothetical protein
MSRLYITLLAIASLWIASIGAVFSIAGLTHLFSGATYSIILMASALEFAKLVTAGFLYRYWGHVGRVMRYYLSCAVVALSLITSLGIFGYLSNAYQKSSMNFKTENIKLGVLNEEDSRIQDEVKRIQAEVASVPRSRITKRLALQDSFEPQIRELEKRSDAIHSQMAQMKLEMVHTQTTVGPLIYVAEAFDTDVDKVAKSLILLFVSIFDPLAICLVFATNLAIRLREKYRGNETRIASLAFTTPVDHRFKKGA